MGLHGCSIIQCSESWNISLLFVNQYVLRFFFEKGLTIKINARNERRLDPGVLTVRRSFSSSVLIISWHVHIYTAVSTKVDQKKRKSVRDNAER